MEAIKYVYSGWEAPLAVLSDTASMNNEVEVAFGNQLTTVPFLAGNADIVTVDCSSGNEMSTTHVNQKIRKLLAVGSRFALALLPFFDASYKNLIVIDLHEKKVVGGCTVPHSKYECEKSLTELGKDHDL